MQLDALGAPASTSWPQKALMRPGPSGTWASSARDRGVSFRQRLDGGRDGPGCADFCVSWRTKGHLGHLKFAVALCNKAIGKRVVHRDLAISRNAGAQTGIIEGISVQYLRADQLRVPIAFTASASMNDARATDVSFFESGSGRGPCSTSVQGLCPSGFQDWSRGACSCQDSSAIQAACRRPKIRPRHLGYVRAPRFQKTSWCKLLFVRTLYAPGHRCLVQIIVQSLSDRFGGHPFGFNRYCASIPQITNPKPPTKGKLNNQGLAMVPLSKPLRFEVSCTS